MIRVDISEQFPILASVVDESTGTLSTGQIVYYDIRDMSDNPLSPPVSGTLTESVVEPGIYSTTESLSTDGQYIVYATCSGYITNTEDVIVNAENIYTLVKQNRHYNISVEDVVRVNVVPTASQTARNVDIGDTDYITSVIKRDDDSDWSGDVITGVVYAWYKSLSDNTPYKMGGTGI